MSFIVQWFYLLALSLWVGGIVFFSFFTTPAIFSNLPKETASPLIGALFPPYYMLGYFAGGTLLLMALIEASLVKHLPWIRLAVILLMLASTLYAGMVLRPKVHDLKVQLNTIEEQSEIGVKLKRSFDQVHRFSVILNLIVLIGGLVLIGILAFRLRL